MRFANLLLFTLGQHDDLNSIPDEVLAFLMSQSQRARYSNAESSISNLATSMSEVSREHFSVYFNFVILFNFNFVYGSILVTCSILVT